MFSTVRFRKYLPLTEVQEGVDTHILLMLNWSVSVRAAFLPIVSWNPHRPREEGTFAPPRIPLTQWLLTGGDFVPVQGTRGNVCRQLGLP